MNDNPLCFGPKYNDIIDPYSNIKAHSVVNISQVCRPHQ